MGLLDGRGKALAMPCLGIVTPQVHQILREMRFIGAMSLHEGVRDDEGRIVVGTGKARYSR
jgi:hypothetical protein